MLRFYLCLDGDRPSKKYMIGPLILCVHIFFKIDKIKCKQLFLKNGFKRLFLFFSLPSKPLPILELQLDWEEKKCSLKDIFKNWTIPMSRQNANHILEVRNNSGKTGTRNPVSGTCTLQYPGEMGLTFFKKQIETGFFHFLPKCYSTTL